MKLAAVARRATPLVAGAALCAGLGAVTGVPASAATATPSAEASCTSVGSRPAVTASWSGVDTVTVGLTGAITPCTDVTVVLSSYAMPTTWDGKGWNATAYPQSLFSSTSITFPAGSPAVAQTRSVSLPDSCTNAQVDLYYAPVVTSVGAGGHGGQYISSRLRKAGACVPIVPTATPTPTVTPTPEPTPTVTPTTPTTSATPTPSVTSTTTAPTPEPGVVAPTTTSTPTPSVSPSVLPTTVTSTPTASSAVEPVTVPSSDPSPTTSVEAVTVDNSNALPHTGFSGLSLLLLGTGLAALGGMVLLAVKRRTV